MQSALLLIGPRHRKSSLPRSPQRHVQDDLQVTMGAVTEIPVTTRTMAIAIALVVAPVPVIVAAMAPVTVMVASVISLPLAGPVVP